MQQQATPLVRAGFNDLGTYGVDKMPGVLIRILFQPQTYVTAQICEHPRTGGWTEFATRYTDGSSDFLTTLPDQGIVPPPFARTMRADKSTPTDRLYQQHLAQRKSGGIKPVAASEVVHEMEDAYMRYMVWKSNKGLTPEEVAHVTAKWAKAKLPPRDSPDRVYPGLRIERVGFLVGSAPPVVIGVTLIVLAPGRQSRQRAVAA